MPVKDIMTQDVITVKPEENIATMHTHMATHNIRHLIVVDEKIAVKGIVSDRDIMRYISPYAGTPSETERDHLTLCRQAHQIMSRHPISVKPEDSIKQAAEKLVYYNISCLPVIDRTKKLRGVVTFKDILNFGIQ